MVFNGWNATKALAHGCKLQQYCIQKHVKMCDVPTSDHALKLFWDLYDKKIGASDAKKSGADAVTNNISHSQSESLEHYANKRRRIRSPNYDWPPSGVGVTRSCSAHSVASITSVLTNASGL